MVDDRPYILAIDTSTPCSTVAITAGGYGSGRVLASVSLSSDITHSRRLLTSIDWLLTATGFDKNQLAGYAVGLGPGSFTGLRIGMATAKGLAAAAGKPLYGRSTLDVIGAANPGDLPVRVVLDARKKEVYTALYHTDGDSVKRIGEVEAMSPETLVERIEEKTVLTGDGLKPYREYWEEEIGERIVVAPPHLWSPSAAVLGLMVGDLQSQSDRLDPGSAVPLYVRASDAELNLKRKVS